MAEGQRTLLTFGGAYSNHIRATAAAGHYLGFSTIGVIRGEEHLPLNPSLTFAVERGMNLCYLNRADYRRKTETDVIEGLRQRFGSFYLLPEGGSNELAVRGCTEIVDEIGPRVRCALLSVRNWGDAGWGRGRVGAWAASDRVLGA